MELGPQNHNGDGLLGLNSIMVVYMDPLGFSSPQTLNPKLECWTAQGFGGGYKL